MQLPRSPADAAILSAVLFPFFVMASGGIDCTKVVIDRDHHWDLSALKGPKSVMHSEDLDASWRNTTYTIDICRALVKKEKANSCPNGTRGLFSISTSNSDLLYIVPANSQ